MNPIGGAGESISATAEGTLAVESSDGAALSPTGSTLAVSAGEEVQRSASGYSKNSRSDSSGVLAVSASADMQSSTGLSRPERSAADTERIVSTAKQENEADEPRPPRRPVWHLGRIINRHNAFQCTAIVFCFFFGLSLIFNTQPACDGVWFWYGFFLRAGKHLYSDMHLALQPLYLLETSAFTGLLGTGWLVSKVQEILHLLAYCAALFFLVRRSNLSDMRKAILFACAFFASLAFGAIGYGDYQVIADVCKMFSVLALLSLCSAYGTGRALTLTAVLGVLSGLTITARLNDGAALFVGVCIAIICLAPFRKGLSVLSYALVTGLTLIVIVQLTGDSLHDYAAYSIFQAAGIKGGGGSLLADPFRLPWETAAWLFMSGPFWTCVHTFAAACILALFLLPVRQQRGRWQIALAAVGLVGVALHADRMGLFIDGAILAGVTGFLVVLAYIFGVWVVVRLLMAQFHPERIGGWDKREILLLIPLGQMAAGSMSSGGAHSSNVAGQISLLIVLLVICGPVRVKVSWVRDVLVALAILMVFCTVNNRFVVPFHWHTYKEKLMFLDRVWYRHPEYGSMLIEKDLLALIQPVCKVISDGGADKELLSLPYPYANYFCSIPPWRGYVQTFYDTTSKETVQRLMNEVRESPPKWIFYQRQLKTLSLHEFVYNHGKPLQQRYLDDLIEQKIRDRVWHVVFISNYGTQQQWGALWDNEWILIQTR